MDGLRLKGFRSLVDTGVVKIKPITIIVGQNSSGKSTFLRTLPLIAQSTSTRSNSPVLWYGDYVDFGQIGDVVSTFSEDDTITLELHIGSNSDTLIRVPSLRRFPASQEAFRIAIKLKEMAGKTALCGFEISSNSDEVSANIEGGNIKGLNLNGRDVSEFLKGQSAEVSSYHLIPSVYFYSNNEDEDGFPSIFESYLLPALNAASRVVQEALHKKTSEATAKSLVAKINYQSEPGFTKSLQAISDLKTWSSFVKKIEKNKSNEEIAKIRELIFVAKLPRLLEVLQQRVANLAAGISYVGPARATSERYYRIRELAVDQIDPRGENLAMFLNSLTESEQDAFSKWVEDSVGHAVRVIRNEGHIQLHLREKSSEAFHNLADTGYGFSQILPVLAQVWSRNLRRRPNPFRNPSMIAIEQPELHLHPAYQAQLADVFAAALNSKTRPSSRDTTKFLIETHSEAFVNRIGELVFEKKLRADDVTVLVFEKSARNEETKVSVASFDDEGILDNWPQGFFSRKAK